ncbi:Uncharacterized protein TCAP_02632 [Tolypocladium capitatum]|uniref:Uncharacterized protein n=1 Tax=Tolypocladium capitatum TaxID=45235 RepID=A0A2K3QIR9_9HYPO|nr:Uncharacterized protein TCAP_02632 [Tolypocladium capitatum]
MDPRLIASPPPGPGIALQLRPESQIPDHPGSMVDVPRPMAPTMTPIVPMAPTGPIDIRNVKTSCQFGLREYLSLQRKRQRFDASTSTVDLESRIGAQANVVLGDLRTLQSEIRRLAKAAEDHRWRRWLFGGAIAAFIPAVRRIFRRGSDQESQSSSNDTEYAFRKSKGLMSRIKDGILGGGSLAKIAFFVFAVLYVFQNEVSLRVAKTMHKRIKKLCERIERGGPDVDERDINVLDGWRWRVLLW